MSETAAVTKVAVIGAAGRMGGLYADRCARAGLEVAGVDKPLRREDLVAALDGAEVVLLSVPAQALEPVLDALDGVITPGHILTDNTSVKVWPMQLMTRRFNGPVVGCHPLFGPEPPAEARVAIIPGRADDARDLQAAATVAALHQRLGFTPFTTTAETHDEAMALIQGLNFVTSAAYLAALSRRDELRDFLTPSFERRLEAARTMCTDDAQLFATLFEANPYSQDAVRRYRNFLQAAASGDVEMLVELAGWWFEDHPHGAHSEKT